MTEPTLYEVVICTKDDGLIYVDEKVWAENEGAAIVKACHGKAYEKEKVMVFVRPFRKP